MAAKSPCWKPTGSSPGGTGHTTAELTAQHTLVYAPAADSGRLQAVSARCTHLGCLVGFNRAKQACAEQARECPCHGFRFAPDGRITQGPAVRPLGEGAASEQQGRKPGTRSDSR
ncbi:Rieske 2Fe-2S domain-containing protein [Streptomyces sp. NPDC059468]|uniref:Rieske 2Fe-2S domain-containing protein n=1 Tax=Streptomyces sp. NPDC059468 TaxID=3346845 RepID=UPI0036BDBC6B